MFKRFGKALLTVPLLAVGFTTAVGLPASAGQPAGCTLNIPTISQASNGQLVGYGSAFCKTKVTRTFGVLIYWDKSFAPDPLVTKGDVVISANNYSKTIRTCNSQATRGYYTQASFVGFDYYESGRETITPC